MRNLRVTPLTLGLVISWQDFTLCRLFPIVLFKCFCFCMLCCRAHPKHIFSGQISTHLGSTGRPGKDVCVIYLRCITRNSANQGPFPSLLLKLSSPVGFIWSVGHVGSGVSSGARKQKKKDDKKTKLKKYPMYTIEFFHIDPKRICLNLNIEQSLIPYYQ